MNEEERISVINRLHADCLYAQPVGIDWSSLGMNDGLEYWEAATCDECGHVQFVRGEEECDKCGEYISGGEGPMMNYMYFIEIDDVEEAAKKISDLPLCVVELNGATGLALTGGGMDLSWEICSAFIKLGQLPPLHFCRLPRMAGKEATEDNLLIVEACMKSCDVGENWARNGVKDLLVVLEGLRPARETE